MWWQSTVNGISRVVGNFVKSVDATPRLSTPRLSRTKDEKINIPIEEAEKLFGIIPVNLKLVFEIGFSESVVKEINLG